MPAPILAESGWKSRGNDGFPRGTHHIRVEGGLHYISGNSAPYFSITATLVSSGTESGGCLHDEIERRYPGRFSDLIRLHLSDVNGAPMHALENGFYWLGGTNWQTTNYDVAARHFRITEEDARALVRDLFGFHFSESAGFLGQGAARDAKARLAAWVETQRPRWKQEADACVARHGLVVYGDSWTPPAASKES